MAISQDPQNPSRADTPPSAVANLAHIQARVAASTHESRPAPIVIAVTKTVPVETITPVIIAGHRHFGENRVQEAAGKWPALRKLAANMTLHLIGPLQTNKVSEAVGLFDTIQTVDRPKLAEKLGREMDTQGRRLDCFVQVNTGREPQKAGVDPADADRFVAQCRDEFRLPVVGLMCVPPVTDEPSPHFALLREIARRNGLNRLSMGMSGDFEIALMFGATHVRIGSAIFGART
ncbi:MAG: YggS family pyridoxal phosphate-dependent enzyme [Rhodospirillaceae bacterium]|nr:MAG: YggS family pyridoxal phosphate-dependent enzyme [Rhodospirillaceae bacterium]